MPIKLHQGRKKILELGLITLGMLGFSAVSASANANNLSTEHVNYYQLVKNLEIIPQPQQSNNNQNNGNNTTINNNLPNGDNSNNNNNNGNNQNNVPNNNINGRKSNAYDISQWQGNISNNQAKELKHEVQFMILKVDQGGYEDQDFVNNSAQLNINHVPYGVYDYSVYHNPYQAQQEARAVVNQAPHAKFYVNDSEIDNAGTQLNNSTQAWANEVHALTRKPAVLYSDLSFINNHFSAVTRHVYNAMWIASYGVEPDPSWHYDLWQYTNHAYSPALQQNVDADAFPVGNNKPLSFWTGKYHHKVRAYIHHKSHAKRHHYRKHYHVEGKYHHHVHIYKGYYHTLPKDKWLKVTRRYGINLYNKSNNKVMGRVNKGTVLQVTHYDLSHYRHGYDYRAQGIHWGIPDLFTANTKYMTNHVY